MNATAERTKVSLLAEQCLDDIRNGRTHKFKKKEEIEIKEKPRSQIIPLFILFCFLCTGIFYGFELTKNKVTGFAVAKDSKKLKDSKVVFYCIKSEKSYSCWTDKDSNFSTRLPNGDYKVYVEDHGSLESSKVEINVSGDSNFRITSYK
jgi:hypothetical protein